MKELIFITHLTSHIPYLSCVVHTIFSVLKKGKIGEIYNIGSNIEKRNIDNWDLYLNSSCGNCIESSLTSGKSLYFTGKLVQNPGTYRLICLYGLMPGEADQDKIKLYSNSFSVQ